MSGARPRFDEVFVRCVPIFASCGMRFVDLPHSPASLARFFGDATWFCGVVAKCRERNEGGGGAGLYYLIHILQLIISIVNGS